MRFRARFIPVLLLRNGRLVKTRKFANDVYLGDPINAVRIFNDKGADEIAILDISLGDRRAPPDIDMLKDIVNEAFVPIAYGGRLRTIDQVGEVLRVGVEKVVLNTVLHDSFEMLADCARRFGSQSLVASIDVKSTLLGGARVHTDCGRRRTAHSPVDLAVRCAAAGAGEILLTSIDRDGMMAGYDIALIKQVSAAVQVPVIAAGGAGSTEDLRLAVRDGGACAAAAGSFFVFSGPRKGVLISYAVPEEMR